VIKIGLTGGYHGGKSTVTGMFGRLGAAVIDADKIAHDLIENDERVCARIIQAFGHGIVDAFDNVVRDKLAKLAFSDGRKLEHLNSILHPPVIKIIRHSFLTYEKQGQHAVAVAEVPLLVEEGTLDLYDKIIVVDCDYQNRLNRFLKKGDATKEKFDTREQFQMELADKLKYADYVINNNGSAEETLNQVIGIWNKLTVNQIKM